MKSRRFLDSRVGSLVAAVGMLVSLAAPSLLTTTAYAATVAQDRSMQLSDSGVGATGVSYKLTFTPSSTEPDAVVIVDFCGDSPIVGVTCDPPEGFNASGATLPAGVTATGDNRLTVASALTGGNAKVIEFNNITNPEAATTSSAGFYARIYTYVDDTAADGNTSATALGDYIDAGGIAMAITNPIQVSAAVRETMTFCVASQTITASCGDAAAHLPSLELGTGTPKALSPNNTDKAEAFTQISTNALKGAVVNMKIGNKCGGLFRSGEATDTKCDIPPVGTGHDPITEGAAAKFGMRVKDAVTTIGGSSGSIVPGTNYAEDDEYGMNWVSGNATGVGSDYGDPIYTSDGAPINNIIVPLEFAATITNTTPAGLYKANLNLIATGTY